MRIFFMPKELIISLTRIERINSDSVDRSEDGNKRDWPMVELC